MDLMLLAFIVVTLVGTTALCIWAAKVGMKNQKKHYNSTTHQVGAGAEQHRRNKEIVEVKYLGSVTRTGVSGLDGAAVGCLVGGILGILAGALIPGDKQKHRFVVKYSDGSVKIREVSSGSAAYNKLVAYLKEE